MSDCWDDSVCRGATWNRTVEWDNEGGTSVDLTGAVVRHVISKGDTAVHESTTGNGGVSILTPASDGRFRVLLSAGQTLTLPAGVLSHDVWVTLGANVVHLVCGRLAVGDC